MSDRQLEAGRSDSRASSVVHAPPPTTVIGTEDITLNRKELLAGVEAGLLAGVAMGLVAIVVSLSYNLGPWRPFNDVAGAIIRPLDKGIAFSPLSVVVGIIIHFTISALLGLIFAAIYAGLLKLTFKVAVPLLVGVCYGMMTWFVARYAFLPLIGTGVYGMPAFIMAHAVFGATLGALYPLMPARR